MIEKSSEKINPAHMNDTRYRRIESNSWRVQKPLASPLLIKINIYICSSSGELKKFEREQIIIIKSFPLQISIIYIIFFSSRGRRRDNDWYATVFKK